MNLKSLVWNSLIVVSLIFGGSTVSAQDVDKTPKVVKSIDDLLKELGSDDYDVRENATIKLAERGAKDKEVYKKVKKLNEKTTDPEVKSRTTFLIQKLNPKNPPKSVDRSKDKQKRIIPPRNQGPGIMPDIPGLKDLKELDFGKLFGGGDMDKAFEELGVPKDLMKTLKKVLAGEEVDPQKLLEDYLKGSQPKAKPAPRPKAPKPQVKPNPKDPKFFGVRWNKPSDMIRAQLGVKKEEGGIIVLQVIKGTYADKAGLKKHDLILAIKGKFVTSPDAFEGLKDGAGEVVVVRGGKRIKLKFPKWDAPKRKVKKDGDF